MKFDFNISKAEYQLCFVNDQCVLWRHKWKGHRVQRQQQMWDIFPALCLNFDVCGDITVQNVKQNVDTSSNYPELDKKKIYCAQKRRGDIF